MSDGSDVEWTQTSLQLWATQAEVLETMQNVLSGYVCQVVDISDEPRVISSQAFDMQEILDHYRHGDVELRVMLSGDPVDLSDMDASLTAKAVLRMRARCADGDLPQYYWSAASLRSDDEGRRVWARVRRALIASAVGKARVRHRDTDWRAGRFVYTAGAEALYREGVRWVMWCGHKAQEFAPES